MKNLTPFFSAQYRQRMMEFHREKAFNSFLSKYEWTGLTDSQEAYLMRKAWGVGTWALFKIGNEEAGLFAISSYGANAFDSYNIPTSITIANERDNPLYPTFAHNGETAVIGWSQYDRNPISPYVETLITNIVDVECIIKAHEFAQKCGLLITCTPETESALKDLMNKIKRDEAVIYVKEAEINAIKALITGVPYNLDKLYQHKKEREAELQTYLGIDNSPSFDFERLTVDQTNSNNAEIDNSQDNFLDNFKKFCKQAKEVLGIDISVKAKQNKVTSFHDDVNQEEEEKENVQAL